MTTTDPGKFSVQKAMAHLAVVAHEKHQLGTLAHDKVRDYLVQTIQQHRLEPEVQRSVSFAALSNRNVIGHVENVLTRIKGTNPDAPALLLAAHYDSGRGGPGASDDGSGVAVLLEVMRILSAEAPPPRDVIFLFSDGEEMGLLGAFAFVEYHPWAKRIGHFLNFEARGSSGPSVLFETSSPNGGLLDAFAAGARFPRGSSLNQVLYSLIPNDTDFTELRKTGALGMNFAYLSNFHHYHTALDTIEQIDKRSLFHQGDYGVEMTRQLLRQNAKATHTQDAFITLPGGFIVRATESITSAAGLAIIAIFAILAFRFTRQDKIRWGQASKATGFILLAVLVTGGLVFGIRKIFWDLNWIFNPDTRPDWYLLGFSLLVLPIALKIMNKLIAKYGKVNVATGAMLLWIIIFAVTLLRPGATAFFILPVGGAIALWALYLTHGEDSIARRPLLVTLAGAPIALTAGILAFSLHMLIPDIPAALIAITWLIGLLFFPLFSALPVPRSMLQNSAMLLGVLVIIVTTALPYSVTNTRKMVGLNYIKDLDDNSTFWVAEYDPPARWVEKFANLKMERKEMTAFMPGYGGWIKAPAPDANLIAPTPQLIAARTVGADERELEIKITSGRKAEAIRIAFPKSVSVKDMVVDGKPFAATKEYKPGWSGFFYVPGEQGFIIKLRVKGAQNRLDLRVLDFLTGFHELPPTDYVQLAPNEYDGPLSNMVFVGKTWSLALP